MSLILKKKAKHPVDAVKWVQRDKLLANDYNPNAQAQDNYDLLITSLKEDGWTQPIVVRPEDENGMHIIVDGEHRWKAAMALSSSVVPVVVLDKDSSGCIAATVRHNRARGAHGVDHMHHLIGRLRAEGQESDAIETMLGMTREERERLESSEDAFLHFAAGKDQSMEA